MEVNHIRNIVDVCSRSLEQVALRAHATVDNYIDRKTEWVLDSETGVEFPARLSDQEALSLLEGKPTPIQVKDGVYFYIPPMKPALGKSR